MKDKDTSAIEMLWKFAREEKYIHDFEKWLYEANELEAEMPKPLYLEVLSFNYKEHSSDALKQLKNSLKEWLEANYEYQCPCITLKDLEDRFDILASYNVDQYEFVLNHLENNCKTLAVRNDQMKMVVCPHCQTCWYLGHDFFRDGFLLKRLSVKEIENIQERNEWPSDFEERMSFNYQII